MLTNGADRMLTLATKAQGYKHTFWRVAFGTDEVECSTPLKPARSIGEEVTIDQMGHKRRNNVDLDYASLDYRRASA